MASRRAVALAAALVVAPLQAAQAWGGEPADQLLAGIDQVVQILADPALRGDAKAAERRAAVRRVANAIFDFEEISRRSLGRHWHGRTEAERAEFVHLFGDLVERSYFTKIDTYSGEKIAFIGEAIDGDQATVRTKIITKQGTEIPVDYRMSRHGDRWRAYDVSIEGVSLVANYRTQFDRIIQRTSFQQLVKQVRQKR